MAKAMTAPDEDEAITLIQEVVSRENFLLLKGTFSHGNFDIRSRRGSGYGFI